MDETEKYRRALLKAYTVVEWVAGEGYVLPKPHYDADDLLLELARLLAGPEMDIDSAKCRELLSDR